MPTSGSKFGFLSNNMLKIIAAIFMVCDHMGVILFPKIEILRIIGRLSFPIFAYLIAEGAKHTKNKLRHFLTMFSFAAVIQIVYFIYDRSLEMSVLVTFTLSLVIIYALDALKSEAFALNVRWQGVLLTSLLFIGSIAFALAMDKTVDLDYGFSGCLLPVLPSLFNIPRTERKTEVFERLDRKLPRILMTSIGILALSFDYGGTQFFSLLTIPLLLLYSEKRGKYNMKYFFYVFYPLHLVILQGIAWLIG
jgi:hypothetical protein